MSFNAKKSPIILANESAVSELGGGAKKEKASKEAALKDSSKPSAESVVEREVANLKKESKKAASQSTSPKATSLKLIPSRMVKSVSPIGMRVLVKIKDGENKTEAGLYLPEGAKEEQEEAVLAEVVEVASALDEELDEETNISGIPLGATVLISKEVGIKVPWDDTLLLVETADVLALVEEFQLS